jgi:HAD superfamily hydrolase (TIGR01549 family)
MIKLIIFDMDGTVFDSSLDWAVIKQELQITDHILKEIYADDLRKSERLAILENHERENTQKIKPIPGIEEFIAFFKKKGIYFALVTNNNRENTNFLLNKYNLQFDFVLTREQGLWKPDAAPLLHTMEYFACLASETVSVGDSHYDLLASIKANIPYIYLIESISLKNKLNTPGEKPMCSAYSFFSDYYQLKTDIVTLLGQ